MSRTRRTTTAAAAALAAVLGVGVMTAPVGATTALWQDQVTVPGVTVVAATPEEPPIVVEPDEPLDPIELPPGHDLAFYYNVTLDLSKYELPIFLGLEHGWSTVTGSATQFGSTFSQYWVNGTQGPISYTNGAYSATARARTWHLFYRAGDNTRPNGYAETPVPAGATSITVRFKVHAVHYDYASTASFRLSGGSGAASFYPPASTSGPPSTEPVFQVPFELPDLYWNGPAVGGARSAAAGLPATAPASAEAAPPATTTGVPQPTADPAATTPAPGTTSGPDPAGVPTRDEDLGTSP